jgi:hypothetical protein
MPGGGGMNVGTASLVHPPHDRHARKVVMLAHKVVMVAHKIVMLAHKIVMVSHIVVMLTHKIVMVAHIVVMLAHKIVMVAHIVVMLTHNIVMLGLDPNTGRPGHRSKTGSLSRHARGQRSAGWAR